MYDAERLLPGLEGARIKLQVKMDCHDSMEAVSKRLCITVLLFFSEFDNTLAVYWNRVYKELPCPVHLGVELSGVGGGGGGGVVSDYA